ncbi:MAG: hypothetical protein QHH75_13615 [Bacillota bacterium]|nr:hypothetical protein [Bacillota bacterium]
MQGLRYLSPFPLFHDPAHSEQLFSHKLEMYLENYREINLASQKINPMQIRVGGEGKGKGFFKLTQKSDSGWDQREIY